MTEKLYVFLWEAIADNGSTMKGEITSTSVERAEEALQEKGVNPTSVRRKGPGASP